jgi:hypothetical protein
MRHGKIRKEVFSENEKNFRGPQFVVFIVVIDRNYDYVMGHLGSRAHGAWRYFRV